MTRRFYRTIKQETPVRTDFVSDRARGVDPPLNPARVRYWEGFSVFETLDQARARAIANPRQGAFIAELVIPEDSPLRAERWGRNEGHYTIWGDPETVLQCVTRVVPVQQPAGGMTEGSDL